MFLFRRILAAIAVLMLVFLSATDALCAKKHAAAGGNKVRVPTFILKGAAVMAGRAFYSSRVPEDALANIRLGREAREILARWGNPTRVTVGSTEAQVPTGAAPTQAGPAYIPQLSGYGSMSQGLGLTSSLLGMQRPGGLPALPGLGGPPGTTSGGAQSGGDTGGGETKTLEQEEITWTYDLANGITLEFIITDGLITQITVGGMGPWGLSKTRTGLQLGDTYKLVLWVCGYPESQKYVGRFLRASYVSKSRVLYTFLNKRLVGITIAMVESELTL